MRNTIGFVREYFLLLLFYMEQLQLLFQLVKDSTINHIGRLVASIELRHGLCDEINRNFGGFSGILKKFPFQRRDNFADVLALFEIATEKYPLEREFKFSFRRGNILKIYS